MNLIEKLKAGKRNIKVIKWPGTDEEIGLTVLTESDIQDSIIDAERLIKAKGIEISATTIGLQASEQNTQILYRALVNPEKKKADGACERYFRTADEFRAIVTREVKDLLIEEYNAWEAERSPSPLKLTDDEFQKIFDEVKKTPTYGNDLNLITLRGLITSLAGREAKSPKASGSISS